MELVEANQLTLNYGNCIMDYVGRPHVITRALKCRKASQRCSGVGLEKFKTRGLDLSLLGLKMEKGSHAHGLQEGEVAPGKQPTRKQGLQSYTHGPQFCQQPEQVWKKTHVPNLQKATQPCWFLGFSLEDPLQRTNWAWTSDLQNMR